MYNKTYYVSFLKKTVNSLTKWISGGVFVRSFAYAKAGL